MRIKECSIVSLFLNPAVCILRDAGGISPYPQNPRYARASGILAYFLHTFPFILAYFPIYPCILARLSLLLWRWKQSLCWRVISKAFNNGVLTANP